MKPLLVALAVLALLALAPAPTGAEPPSDPFAELLFPPDLIMAHQAEIGLSPDQREQLVAELRAAQADFIPLQLELSAEAENLRRELRKAVVDEALALESAGRLMELETSIKRRHMALAIRLKNLLTPGQQTRLQGLRTAS